MSADPKDTGRLPDEASGAFENLPASDRSDFQNFVETFVSRRRFDDADLLSAGELAEAALDIWRLSAQRAPGTPVLRVSESVGSRAGRTVVQIITDDMPFLTDSVLAEFDALGVRIEAVLHPVVDVQRDGAGKRLGCASAGAGGRPRKGGVRESILHIELANAGSGAAILEERLLSLLDEVRTVVSDFLPMTERLEETAKELARNCPLEDKEELGELVEFLRWLAADHFAFFGVREYRTVGDGEMQDLEMVEGAGLGILRDPDMMVLRRGTEMVVLTPELRAFLTSTTPMIVTKANVRSRVHRRVHMDYVGVKLYSKKGDLVGERRFVGLFTAAAYNRNTREIPLLRRKTRRVMEATGALGGYDERALLNILETFPRDELFQIPEETLVATALGILKLTKRPRASFFARNDPFDRFVSVLVFIPRERYGTSVERRIGEVLARAYAGAVSTIYPAFGDQPLARVHYIIRRGDQPCPNVDRTALEAEIETITRDWRDELDRLLEELTRGAAVGLAPRYAQAFRAGYRESYLPDEAVRDITQIEALLADSAPDFGIRSYRGAADGPDHLRVKLYRAGTSIILSDAIPVFERMGLRVMEETSYEVTPRVDIGHGRTEARPFWIQELHMAQTDGLVIDLDKVREAFEAAFLAIWSGAVESDGFNQLVLTEGLDARNVVILRAVARYLRQTAIPFSLDYMERGLAAHPRIAGLMVALFAARFDPGFDGPRAERIEMIHQQIVDALDDVSSADEDRIIRRMMNVILATKRTNFYQRTADGAPRAYLALKIRSGKVEELPLPKPYAEIFVYSPRVEGVHLRFGKVARGGLRWSDRREDFRTEVLGLVKAQQVKNAVIVPVGAKGGFVPKLLPDGGTREEIQAEAIASYQTFINGLLDLTDNYVGEDLVRPRDTVIHDDDDPYLVVAADKGTATFSDIANALAVERGFWLGDAFASGGSQGYDHKKMGITARGGWEAVKRHFREMGRDIQREPFTAAGVGDMSGDVFGNGMLLSRQTRLLAAFDHRDIFIDPDPDVEISYKERERLFETPRSSWQDYAKKALSKGGAVYSRRAKLVELSPEAQALLGVSDSALPPTRIIQAILRLDVDLLWFGGIGTYVRGETESDFDVGDRANDPVRVEAREVRAKVVGEGANLGFTQLARIAFARAGGRINSDAIDNSAGVDSSDHEVNLKILLDSVVASGGLSVEARNALLVEMTEEVAHLVLQNNYDQTLALSLAEATAAEDIDAHGRFMRRLERDGRLARHVEFLPDEESLRELSEAGLGLTRPEIAVLFAYAKIAVFDAVVASDVPDDPRLDADLEAYFPERLRGTYRDAIHGHRLRRELISTLLANDAVNMGGLTFVPRIAETAGVEAPHVLRAHAVTRAVFGLSALQDRINALDLEIPAPLQVELHLHLRGFLRRQVLWFLRIDTEPLPIGRYVDAYAPGIAELGKVCDQWLTGLDRANRADLETRYIGAGVPEDVAAAVADLLPLQEGCDIIDVSSHWSMPLVETARAYSELGATLGLDRLRSAAGALKGAEHWERLANRRLLEDMFRLQRSLTHAAIGQAIFEGGTGLEGPAIVEHWAQIHEGAVRRAVQLVTEMESAGRWNTAKLTLAVQQFRDLAEGPAGQDELRSGAEA